MTDLSTTYLGLRLNNPLVVGSSTHTITADKIRKLEDAGAGAVVLKSIFEEQIRAEVADMYESLENDLHPEAYEYLRADIPMQIGPEKYLARVREIKATTGIPVIASINCTTADKWVSFARKIEVAGADAMELNVYDIPDSPETTGVEIEARHVELVRAISEEVNIPVSVKLGPFYTSIIGVVRQLAELKIAGIVLFNRFFQPDINIEELKLTSIINLSRPEDIRLPLRWIAILRDQVECDLCLTTGVHDHEGAVKALLAGANAFQICSVLYRRDPSHIADVLDGIRGWMNRHGFSSIDEFRGMLKQKSHGKKQGFERAQYMKTLVGLE